MEKVDGNNTQIKLVALACGNVKCQHFEEKVYKYFFKLTYRVERVYRFFS